MYQWLVFLHILSAFFFFMAHGVSALMAFRLKRETNPERMRAILDFSNFSLPVMYWSLMLLVLAGIGAGIMGHWFAMGWIWAAIVLLVVLWIGMWFYAARFYAPVRKALGMPYREMRGDLAPVAAASEAEIRAAVQRTNPALLGGVSFALIAMILWLMMFKPF
ncbi:MAG: hypothetical protein H0X30_25665 [Anaerolineae bacterium]|nr:hypothetical protein [Anaerolineae bacterium]